MNRTPLSFEELPGWLDDPLDDACEALVSVPADQATAQFLHFFAINDNTGDAYRIFRRVWSEAADLISAGVTDTRHFFEKSFQPFQLGERNASGMVTGYFEPEIAASGEKSDQFSIPLYRRPPDLVNLVPESERAAGRSASTHVRQTPSGLEVYPTRAEIHDGALAGQDLELAWLEDAVDAYVLHVQGSGRLLFDDRTTLRVTYDGKNGHPYTSIGAILIAEGHIAAEEMTLEALTTWLRAHPDLADEIMRQNKSYVFFRPIDADHAAGVLGTKLTDLRSLAVDGTHHPLGLPVYVHAADLELEINGRASASTGGFGRLMFAQDAGSAIRGLHRGDIFIGSGRAAGRTAGSIAHEARLYSLIPRKLLDVLEAK